MQKLQGLPTLKYRDITGSDVCDRECLTGMYLILFSPGQSYRFGTPCFNHGILQKQNPNWAQLVKSNIVFNPINNYFFHKTLCLMNVRDMYKLCLDKLIVQKTRQNKQPEVNCFRLFGKWIFFKLSEILDYSSFKSFSFISSKSASNLYFQLRKKIRPEDVFEPDYER